MYILASIILGSVLVAGEQKPDFSGTWIGISPSQVSGQTHLVKQDSGSLTFGHDSSWTLTFGHEPEGEPHSHVFRYKLDGTEARRVIKSHGQDIVTVGTAWWDGNRLVIHERTAYPDGRNVTHRSVWSLNERRELEIETIEQAEGKSPVTYKGVYRKADG